MGWKFKFICIVGSGVSNVPLYNKCYSLQQAMDFLLGSGQWSLLDSQAQELHVY